MDTTRIIQIAIARADLFITSAWAFVMSPFVRLPISITMGALIGRAIMKRTDSR